MNNQEEFEKWWKSTKWGQMILPGWGMKTMAEDAFESRQPEIDSLKADVERLKALLKPFAAYAPHYPLKRTFGNRPATGEWHRVQSGGIPDAQLDVEDFHRAADALKEQK